MSEKSILYQAHGGLYIQQIVRPEGKAWEKFNMDRTPIQQIANHLPEIKVLQ